MCFEIIQRITLILLPNRCQNLNKYACNPHEYWVLFKKISFKFNRTRGFKSQIPENPVDAFYFIYNSAGNAEEQVVGERSAGSRHGFLRSLILFCKLVAEARAIGNVRGVWAEFLAQTGDGYIYGADIEKGAASLPVLRCKLGCGPIWKVR